MTVLRENYQLKVCLDEKMAAAFKEAVGSRNDVPADILECTKQGNLATFQQIQWLHANKKNIAGHLHELLAGCEVRLPEPEVPPRNPELEARIQKLKADQEERDYKRMTKNVDNRRLKHPEDTISYQVRQMNRQLIAVVQFVFSVAAGFLFGFLGIELIVGDLEFGFRLLLGVICSLIIALAEIYFLAKKLAEDDEPFEEPPASVKPEKPPTPNSTSSKPHQD